MVTTKSSRKNLREMITTRSAHEDGSSNIKPTRSYVFDLDGVICVGPHFGAALEREHGIPHSRWGTFFSGVFMECLVGRKDLKAELSAFIPQLGWSQSVDELLHFWFTVENVLCQEALRCVASLRNAGHRCYLGTNQERYRADFIANEMGLHRHFDGIFASGYVGFAKPEREYFHAVQEASGSSDILLVDDSLRNVRGAELAGWKAIHYRGTRDLGRILDTLIH
jgi:putative hydrolase of the HAD superfamily